MVVWGLRWLGMSTQPNNESLPPFDVCLTAFEVLPLKELSPGTPRQALVRLMSKRSNVARETAQYVTEMTARRPEREALELTPDEVPAAPDSPALE
jgi:hypothetical protein